MRRFSFVAILVCALVIPFSVSALAGQTPKGRTSVAKSAPATAAAPVNLNTATAAQIETLPGIGARTAERIIEYRQKNGGFKKVEELMNVKGIGEKSFLKLKPLVVISAAVPDRGSSKQ
jgi:competence protein ComEA